MTPATTEWVQLITSSHTSLTHVTRSSRSYQRLRTILDAHTLVQLDVAVADICTRALNKGLPATDPDNAYVRELASTVCCVAKHGADCTTTLATPL